MFPQQHNIEYKSSFKGSILQNTFMMYMYLLKYCSTWVNVLRYFTLVVLQYCIMSMSTFSDNICVNLLKYTYVKVFFPVLYWYFYCSKTQWRHWIWFMFKLWRSVAATFVRSTNHSSEFLLALLCLEDEDELVCGSEVRGLFTSRTGRLPERWPGRRTRLLGRNTGETAFSQNP